MRQYLIAVIASACLVNQLNVVFASGQPALGVAEGSPEGVKGRLDGWSFPTRTSFARKASSGGPASAEPAYKKRKESDSAAVDGTVSSVSAATSLEGCNAVGEATLHLSCRIR